jgi:serine protease
MATRRSRSRTTSAAPSGPSGPVGGEGAPSIFQGEDDNIIRGEVLIKLAPAATATITESVPTGPVRQNFARTPSGLGIGDVDAVLSQAGCYAITRLHTPPPPTAMVMAEAVALSSTFRARIDAATDVATVVDELNALPDVELAEPNRFRETYVVPNDPDYAQQWGLPKINAPAAWDRTTGSANVVVGVIDTGIDLNHPELAPLLVPGRDLVDLGNAAPPPGFHFEGDFVGADSDPQDEVGHGTHVAGTIACLSNNGTGVAGVTWGCHLMPVRVLARIVNNSNANDVRGSGSAADIAAGIRWATDHGCQVINMSLGGTVDTQVERDAVAYAVAHDVVVVAAMGNSFQQGNPTSFPAAYPDVVAVGAIDSGEHRAVFSQTGPHIDVAGPGVGVRSTYWDDTYANLSGTSMATPHVAGVAALIRSCNSNLPAAQVAQILRDTAKPLRDDPADPVPNDSYGFGLVDAAAALERACPPRRSVPIFTCPSVIVRCPSVPIVACPRPSITLRCPPTLPVVICPRPSITVRCPTFPPTFPTFPPPTIPPTFPPTFPPGPGPIEAAGDPYGLGYDPYAYDPYGYGVEGWYGEQMVPEGDDAGGCQ